MKFTFINKKNISRKSLLWFYFLMIIVLTASLTATGYFVMFKESTASEGEEKNIMLKEEELKNLDEYQYFGVPIDINSGLGKQNPFK